MTTAKIYDKVSWHFPEGKDCLNLDIAKIHFKIITNWLKDHRLLSNEGVEAVCIGIDSDFALTSHMLTPRGNHILARCYSQWVQTVHYGEIPSTELLNKCLARFL